jgi:hypothetical protein
VALRSTQPLKENLLRGKDGRCVGLTTLRTSCADCLEILGASTSCSPKDLCSSVLGCFTFYLQHITGARLAPAQGDYTHRLSAVASTVHHVLATKCGLPNEPQIPYCKYEPQTVLESSMYQLYYEMSIRTVRNNRPGIFILVKTIKEAHSVDVAFRNSYNLHNTIIERLQKINRLERRAYKNMATENGLYNTTSTVQVHFSKQITQKFKTA